MGIYPESPRLFHPDFQDGLPNFLTNWDRDRGGLPDPPRPMLIDTVNMHFSVVQMRLDLHALLLMFTFSHKET